MPKQKYRKISYSKEQVNALFYKVNCKTPTVYTIKLSKDDINKYKFNYNNEDFESYIEETKDYIHSRKKIKESEKEVNILKLVLSRDGGSETSKHMDVCEKEPAKSENSTENMYGKIRVRDPKLMIETHKYESFMQSFFEFKTQLPDCSSNHM